MRWLNVSAGVPSGTAASTIAPNTATRMVPISVRAKFMAPSAAPRSRIGTVFCNATWVSGAVGPKPMPIRNKMISNFVELIVSVENASATTAPTPMQRNPSGKSL